MKKDLQNAKNTKDDEFYTQYKDIEKELSNYSVDIFKNQIVYCPCDIVKSKFVRYFMDNFERLQLKHLYATSIQNTYFSYDGKEQDIKEIENGDCRSEFCKDLMKKSDLIITNLPFSEFRSIFNQILSLNKSYLLLCNQNALMYKEVFPLIMKNEAWTGVNNGEMSFKVPKDSLPRKTRYWIDENGQKWRSMGNICWLTNLDLEHRHKPLVLTNEDVDFKKYSTYDAININKVKEIPKNYNGKMGVPITFLHKYCPEQFEILGELKHGSDNEYDLAKPIVEGKELFTRIIIRYK